MNATPPEFASTFSLHRYFIWCDRMRVHLEAVLEKAEPTGNPGLDIEHFMYMSYWYGGLYVVVEGWKELGLHDAEIDKLLDSPNVDLLRRYRNGVFHFQKDYFDNRFYDFMTVGADTVKWIRSLRDEFSRWFLNWAKSRRESQKVSNP